MKLIRFGEPGKEKPGILIGEKRLDVSSVVDDYNESFFENNGLDKLSAAINGNHSFPEISQNIRLGSSVARPSKIICIGLNYVDHCIETNAPIPQEPIIFFKSTTAFCGPDDSVVIPKNSTKTDWEVELAFVMSKKASYVEESDAMNYVAGYCLHNDYSERAFQLERGGQWAKGKGCDTFAPLGPFLATIDEVKDVNNLSMWLSVNGKKYQNSKIELKTLVDSNRTKEYNVVCVDDAWVLNYNDNGPVSVKELASGFKLENLIEVAGPR
jgi:2-keto-4-pentenoate hydratase/2-oxohepta-3-ene-1,7-dioic acid hydratase in catechol pathway